MPVKSFETTNLNLAIIMSLCPFKYEKGISL